MQRSAEGGPRAATTGEGKSHPFFPPPAFLTLMGANIFVYIGDYRKSVMNANKSGNFRQSSSGPGGGESNIKVMPTQNTSKFPQIPPR